MNKKSKKTLKNAFNIPEPTRKDEFLNSLPVRQKKSHSFNVPLYISTAVTAVIVIGIWGGIKNLPHFDPPQITDTSIYSETTEQLRRTEITSVQTTETVKSSVSEYVTATATSKTSATSAISEITSGSSVTTASSSNSRTTTETSGTGTIFTETEPETLTSVTTGKNNTTSYIYTTEIFTTETTFRQETESPETTLKTTKTFRTTTNTTRTHFTITATTTATTTTTTTESTVNVTTVTTTEELVNDVTTTISIENEPPFYETTQTSGATIDAPPVPITTTPAPPSGGNSHIDFTVVPAVRYYPEGEIYFTDSTEEDNIPPSNNAPDYTGIFRQMITDSDLIAIVEVDEIIYTGIDGVPYTQENVTVKDVIYGDMRKNSRISVYCQGGYIPAEEYFMNVYEENVTVFDYAGNRKFSEAGDTYMCFLKKRDNIYYLTGLNDISKFEIHEDYFVNINNGYSLTLQEIENFLN
ncbi:MAG: hypothetical protein K2G36_08395 [Ruminococcus sp.]|nr:hypothetical protein [Ruminococcus sp.]